MSAAAKRGGRAYRANQDKELSGPAPLTREETVALWHAVNWMDTCLRETRKDEPGTAWLPLEQERLRTAKAALRKVNAIRRAQRTPSPSPSGRNERTAS